MTDFLETKRLEMSTRLDELRPLVDEYVRLQAAAAALDGVVAATGSNGSSRRERRQPVKPDSITSHSRQAAAPLLPQGQRGRQALALVQANPGITIQELADRMGMKQNYLHRLLPGLAQKGLVTKQGRGWHPAAVA